MLLPGGVVDDQAASSVVKGECQAILARQKGVADNIYDKLAASQAQLAQELNRIRKALETVTLLEPLALAPDHAGTLSRIQRKIADLSKRLGAVEARITRIKVSIKASRQKP